MSSARRTARVSVPGRAAPCKLVPGICSRPASAPLAVSLNTQYALRLEVVGNQLRGYVKLCCSHGQFARRRYQWAHDDKAAAQFDDYIAYQPWRQPRSPR